MPAYLGIADRVDTPFGTRPSRLVLLADQRKGILYVGSVPANLTLKRIAADGDFIRLFLAWSEWRVTTFKAQAAQSSSGSGRVWDDLESLAAASDLPTTPSIN